MLFSIKDFGYDVTFFVKRQFDLDIHDNNKKMKDLSLWMKSFYETLKREKNSR